MNITRIPSLKQMSSRTSKLLAEICAKPMRRTGLGRAGDEWTAKIIDNLAAAGYIKREPDGTYAATDKGRRLVSNRFWQIDTITRIASMSLPVRNSTATAAHGNHYKGHELTAPAVRPGTDDHFQCPSLRPDGRYYRDGRVEAP